MGDCKYFQCNQALGATIPKVGVVSWDDTNATGFERNLILSEFYFAVSI